MLTNLHIYLYAHTLLLLSVCQRTPTHTQTDEPRNVHARTHILTSPAFHKTHTYTRTQTDTPTHLHTLPHTLVTVRTSKDTYTTSQTDKPRHLHIRTHNLVTTVRLSKNTYAHTQIGTLAYLLTHAHSRYCPHSNRHWHNVAFTHTHTYTRACASLHTHARARTRTHTRARTHAHAHTHTHIP